MKVVHNVMVEVCGEMGRCGVHSEDMDVKEERNNIRRESMAR